MKRFLKWTGCALATPVLLVLFLVVLLYLPPVQDFAVWVAEERVSEATGYDVRVERLRLSFLLDLDLQGLVARDAVGDTLVAARSVIVDLDLSQLLALRIGVDAITLRGVQADTKDVIATTRIVGSFDELAVGDDIDLRAQHVAIDAVTLRQADVTVVLRDTTTTPDTTSSVIPWTIDIEKASITDSHLSLVMEADKMTIDAALPTVIAEGGHIDLERQLYAVSSFAGTFDAGSIVMAANAYSVPTFSLSADSLAFDGTALRVSIPDVVLRTAASRVVANSYFDLAAFSPGQGGRLMASLNADIGREDIALAMSLADSISLAPITTAWPDIPLHLALKASGNIDRFDVSTFEARLPGSAELEARATATNLLESKTRAANLHFNLRSGNLDWLLRAFDADTRRLRLPAMHLGGTAKLRTPRLDLNARLDEGPGALLLQAKATLPYGKMSALSYKAAAEISALDVHHFLPRDSIGLVSATINVEGRGTDIFASSTSLKADVQVARLQYGRRYDLNDIFLQASLSESQARATLVSDNDLLRCQADIAAMLHRQLSGATFGLDVTSADLHALGLTDSPLNVSACFHIDGNTNLRDHHSIDGTVSDIAIITSDTLIHNGTIAVKALLYPDTVHAYVGSGDLYVTIDTDKGYDRLLRQSARFTAELQRQWQERRFSLADLRQELPLAELHILAGKNNFAYELLQANGIGFDMANIDIVLSPIDGLNCGGQVYKMIAGGMQLDTVSMFAFQDTTGIELSTRIRNGRRNPQFRFESRLYATITDTGSVAQLKYIDERGRTGVDLGLRATIADESLQLSLTPFNPIIAYQTYHVNADNYFRLLKRNHIETDIRLNSDDGTGINLYSTPNADALQDLTLGLHHINLGRLTSVVPYAPVITGLLDGDVHFVQHDTNITMSADITANDLTYEKATLGQVGVQAVYLPNADGSHFVDGSLLHTGMPVLTFGGTLGKAGANGVMSLNVDAALERFPLSLANGFIPDGMASLSGLLMGDVHVGGSTARPAVNGAIQTNDVRLNSDQYSLALRLEDDTLIFDNSQLTLSNLRFFAQGQAPLVVDGTVNFANTENIRLDVNMSAKNYELMNARKTTKALAYGKVYIDLTSQVRGTLDNLRMMGRLKLLGDTDVTYVLTDSPLSAEDQLEGLVEFVDFSDTLRIEEPVRTRPKHLNIIIAMNIDEAAHLHCLLSPDGTNYVNVEGGGDLILSYSPEKDLQLNGRYTVNSGTLKYTMMVIPLKEFNIKNGSYVEFRGPVMNPYLNLSATESLTTSISEYEESRSVAFNVGLSITQTLENMGLEFTIEAPDDQSIQSELSSMTKEQRSRVAVTMLATGMYISDSSTANGLSSTNALNSFLQSQISNIAGKALKTVELSVGVTEGTSSTGSTTRDYSFRLSKRFWNNRINVIVGGRVSTGSGATNTGQSILDNVTVEYRLDKSGTRYVSAFYDKNHESILDGDVTEMGAGIMLRRKTTKLGELFLFKKKK